MYEQIQLNHRSSEVESQMVQNNYKVWRSSSKSIASQASHRWGIYNPSNGLKSNKRSPLKHQQFQISLNQPIHKISKVVDTLSSGSPHPGPYYKIMSNMSSTTIERLQSDKIFFFCIHLFPGLETEEIYFDEVCFLSKRSRGFTIFWLQGDHGVCWYYLATKCSRHFKDILAVQIL